MKKIIYSILFGLPILAILVGVNYTVDPANIFRSGPQQMAKLFQQGKSAYVISGNVEEREVAEKIIENLDATPKCIAVGPSLVRWINSDMVKEESFYNLGMSNGTGYDILAIFGQLEKVNKMPEKILFCVDTFFFDKDIIEMYRQWVPYVEDVNRELKLIGSSTSVEIAENEVREKKLEKYQQLISLTYFQSSLQYISKNGFSDQAMIGEPALDYEGAYYLKDNARVSSKDRKDISVEQVQKEISDYLNGTSSSKLETSITPNASLDTEQLNNFKRLIEYLQKKGVQVKFFLHPYPPEIWEYIERTGSYPMVKELDSFIKEYAEEKQIPITGAYNPFEINCKTEDFQDYRHLKEEALEKYFDFTF